MVSYRQIRREYQSRSTVEEILVDHYAKLLSPLLTPIFIRLGTIPNRVTVYMMIAGLAGAALFAVPSLAAKLCGLVLIHLWYVLDCSDGEVARITRKFSRFGTEMDHTAHMINHPLFNIAFVYSLITLHRYNIVWLLVLGLLSISAELALRLQAGFYHIYKMKMGASIAGARNRNAITALVVHGVQFFSMYPNFVLLFPVVYLVDYFAGTRLALCYMALHTAISCLVAARASWNWVRAIEKIA